MKPIFTVETIFTQTEFDRYLSFLQRDYKRTLKITAVVYALFLTVLKYVLRNYNNDSPLFYTLFFICTAACVCFWFFFKNKADRALKKRIVYNGIIPGCITQIEFYDRELVMTEYQPEDRTAAKEGFCIPEAKPREGCVAVLRRELNYSSIKRINETDCNFYIETHKDNCLPSKVYVVNKSCCKGGLADFIRQQKGN